MRIDIDGMRDPFLAAREGRGSRHAPMDRTEPRLWQYDYLVLSRLSQDVRALLRAAPAPPGARALDLGSDRSPYRDLLASRGYQVETLDISRESGADHAGTVEATGLPDASYDLVLCTQVIEHSMDPWTGLREIARILKPGGRLVLSAPHVWFYHPHPTDHWRFTQEGMVQLCRQAGLVPETLLAQGGSLSTLFQVLDFMVYGVLGRAGAPLYALFNAIALLADRLAPNQLFCHNFACLARRP